MTTTATRPTNRTGSMVRSMLPMILLDIALPIAIYQVAKSYGATDTAAYLLAGIGPLIGIGLQLARTRRLDVVSGLFLAMYAISAGIAAIPSADSSWLLLKDSAMTGAFGLLCLVTLLPVVARPLMFHFGLRFSTDGSPDARRQWDEMWHNGVRFRRVMRVLTVVWGIGYVAEAAVKVVVAKTLDFGTAFALNQVLPTAVTIALVVWTMSYVRRNRGDH